MAVLAFPACFGTLWGRRLAAAPAPLAAVLLFARSRTLRWPGGRAVLIQGPAGAPRGAASGAGTCHVEQVPATMGGMSDDDGSISPNDGGPENILYLESSRVGSKLPRERGLSTKES